MSFSFTPETQALIDAAGVSLEQARSDQEVVSSAQAANNDAAEALASANSTYTAAQQQALADATAAVRAIAQELNVPVTVGGQAMRPAATAARSAGK